MDIEKLKKLVPQPEEGEKKEKSEDEILKIEFQAKKNQIDRLSEEINGEMYEKIEKIITPSEAEKINQLIENANDAYNEAVEAENKNDFHEARLRYDEALEYFINIRKLMVEKISAADAAKPKAEEKTSLSPEEDFKISGTSADELIEKENHEKEIIEKIKVKFREYIIIEDGIINQENAKSVAERNEKRMGAAKTRKRVYTHILSRADWDLETYKKAVESNYDKTRGFTAISDKRYEELIKIIAGGEAVPAKEFEIKKREKTSGIIDNLRNKGQEIKNKLLDVDRKFISEFEGKADQSEKEQINALLNDANQAFAEAVENLENKNFNEAENRFNKAAETAEIALNLINEILKAKKEALEKELTLKEKAKKEILEFFGVEIGDRVIVSVDGKNEYKGIVSGVLITPFESSLEVDLGSLGKIPVPKKFKDSVKKEKILSPEYAGRIKKMEETAKMLQKEYNEKIKDSEFLTDKVKSDFLAALQQDKKLLEELKTEAEK